MKLSVCIPMYNESRVIAETASTLSAYLSSHFEDYELLFSDYGRLRGAGTQAGAPQHPGGGLRTKPGKGVCGPYRYAGGHG